MCAFVCVCAYMCACEREREIEKEREHARTLANVLFRSLNMFVMYAYLFNMQCHEKLVYE